MPEGAPSSPLDVLPEHRKYAWPLYLVLVGGFIGVSVWSVIAQIQQRSNPPTKFSISRELYNQPYYTLCPPDSYNVTVNDDDSYCSYQAGTESGYCNFNTTDLGYGGDCVVFQMVDSTTNKAIQLTNNQDQLIIAVAFKINVSAPLDDIGFEVYNLFVSELGDDDSIIAGDTASLNFGTSQLSVAAQQTIPISGAPKWDYSLQATLTQTVGVDKFVADTNKLGPLDKYVLVEVAIPNRQVSIVTEVDPVSPSVLLGIIGSYWSYVGVIFAAVFIVEQRAADKKYAVFRLKKTSEVEMVSPESNNGKKSAFQEGKKKANGNGNGNEVQDVEDA